MKINYTLSEIDNVAKTILQHTKHKTLLFNGEMGSGKTTLIKAILKQLGVTETVNSPTFAIVNTYTINNIKINHFDCYRLKNEAEAYQMGLDEYFYKNEWNMVEWSKKIVNLLPKEATSFYIASEKRDTRSLITSKL